ncbi:MAG: tetratricopeptide repeat protein [Acidobacteriia bacterium]|nr:tetratricopeptide repeat protein [Terriglobia bacterium]
MAFGFGFNKQKVLSAAEKYVQQGKLQNAISEYEKILKNDAKDLTVTNTVGDLYSRLGEVDKATECFKSVGDAYAGQGFTVKAIAMYKKISKLKPSLESVLKLAELYTQQGLFNDARAQYLQVAEEFLKSGELDNAVRIFQKILEMDPENVNMRVRLAEVYVRLGKKNEAWQIFSAAAESMRSKGSLGGAEEILQRMLTLDPGNTYALLMQGKNLIESGDAEAAITSLQKIGDLDSNPEGLRDLLKAYLQVGRLSDAGTVASKLLTIHNDLPAIATFADALMQAGQYENALQVYDQHADRLLAENSAKVLENLHIVIGHVRDNPASLEKLLDLFHKAGETTHISEVTELLAHASVQSGDLVRARDLYQKLATLEPGNPLHMQNYQQVVSQLGGTSGTKLISAEEAAVIVDELEATSPSIHQHYSDEVALAVRSALTDAELFISYNMPAKALGPLMAALPQAPGDLRLNQRLAALHTRAGRFAEAAVCCRTLQNIYSEAEYPEEATRYGELAERYEERTSTSAVPHSGEEMPIPSEMPVVFAAAGVEEAPAPTEEVAVEEAEESAPPWPSAVSAAADEIEITPSDQAEFAVVEEAEAAPAEQAATPAEIDLSEWEDTVTVEDEAPATEAAGAQDVEETDKITDTIDEIRFYLSNHMREQAWAALAKLQTLTSDEARVAEIRAEVEAATQAASEEELGIPVESEEITVEDIPAAETVAEDIPVAVEEPVAEDVAPAVEDVPVEAEVSSAPEPETKPAPKPAALKEFVADLESSLGEEFLPGAAGKPVEAPEVPEQVEAAHVEAAVAGEHQGPVLGEFVADLESSLGDNFLKAAPVAGAQPAAPVAKAKAAPPAPPAPVAKPKVSSPLAASAAAAAGTPARPSVPTPPAPVPQPVVQAAKPMVAAVPPAAPAPAPAPAAKASPFGDEAGVDLAEMFGELKQDLESDVASADEDPETHYNLGIAFREMGLLDEAIGELQKACQSVDHGHAFPQIMQAYTWLAQCFLEKGVPEAAVRWYERALNVPGIDGETRVALNYELASAYESAGDKPAALRHFMDVYGSNIDYRDVAERIKALKS